VGQPDPAQRAEQQIGHGGEPKSQLIGAHRGRRRAVGEQVELTLLNPVLHLAAGAVDRLIEMPRANLGPLERGDDKARVGVAARPFGLADHAAVAAPAVQRAPGEVAEAARRLARYGALSGRFGKLGLDFLDQPLVARQAEQVIHPVRFAPGHQRLTGEAGTRSQQNAHPRPALADLGDDARPRRRRQTSRQEYQGSGRGQPDMSTASPPANPTGSAGYQR
jgi:hypothetical protein